MYLQLIKLLKSLLFVAFAICTIHCNGQVENTSQTLKDAVQILSEEPRALKREFRKSKKGKVGFPI